MLAALVPVFDTVVAGKSLDEPLISGSFALCDCWAVVLGGLGGSFVLVIFSLPGFCDGGFE
jgi:hypothetical protein